MQSRTSTTLGALTRLALCMGAATARGQLVVPGPTAPAIHLSAAVQVAPVAFAAPVVEMVPAAQTVGPEEPAAATVAYDPQAKDDLLDGLDRLGANAKERNEVNLDKNTLALAGGRHAGRYGDLAQKMDAITVRNYEFAQKGQYQKSDLDALRHRLEGSGWSHIVRNESENETNDIVLRGDREGLISDMVILNVEPREVNIVHLRGHFRMDDVQGAMGSAMGAMGAGMGAMGSAMGHVAAAQHQPPAPPEPPTSTDSKKH